MCPPFETLKKKKKKKRCLIRPAIPRLLLTPPPPPDVDQLFWDLCEFEAGSSPKKTVCYAPPLSQIPGSAPGRAQSLRSLAALEYKWIFMSEKFMFL